MVRTALGTFYPIGPLIECNLALVPFIELFEGDQTADLTWELLACTLQEFLRWATRYTDKLVGSARGDQSLPIFA